MLQMFKMFKSDSITSELNKFKSNCYYESKKKSLITFFGRIISRVNRQTYDFEEKRQQYCELVYKLYNDVLEKNDFETLLDRQTRLLHSTEINNNILIGVVGGLAVWEISNSLNELVSNYDVNIIARFILLGVSLLILIISVVWIYSKLYDSMIRAYKFDNKFGTVAWELKFLEDSLRIETQKTMGKIRIETANDNENSETITDIEIE